MTNFNIPVVLFFFRREDTATQVLKRIREVKPQKIYLMSDGGRNESEIKEVEQCRERLEQLIDWDCEVIKRYHPKNVGVYKNIGEGAKWVLSQEKHAIFLEDDNLPELSFFPYCEELLNKYEDDEKVLWICGTNYLEEYNTNNNYSYMFTRHLLPCGWASWSTKFLKFYDGELTNFRESDKEVYKKMQATYLNDALYKQQKYNIEATNYKIKSDISRSSWDHQMSFSIRVHNLYGISPRVNLIKNIGVDERSTHGGTSLEKTMTSRFCGMDSLPLEFPLNHPSNIEIDSDYEKKIGEIILLPLHHRIFFSLIRMVKPVFGLKKYEKLSLNTVLRRGKN